MFVVLCRCGFEFVGHVSADVQSKQFIYADSNKTLGNAQFDILVYGVCDEARTILTGPSTNWGSERFSGITDIGIVG